MWQRDRLQNAPSATWPGSHRGSTASTPPQPAPSQPRTKGYCWLAGSSVSRRSCTVHVWMRSSSCRSAACSSRSSFSSSRCRPGAPTVAWLPLGSIRAIRSQTPRLALPHTVTVPMDCPHLGQAKSHPIPRESALWGFPSRAQPWGPLPEPGHSPGLRTPRGTCR